MKETEIERMVVRLVGNNKGYIDTLAKTETATKRFVANVNRDLGRVGKYMSLRVTLPILASGAAALKLATSFSSTMGTMQTLVGLTAEEVDKLKLKVIDVSDATGKSAQELAEAMFVITSAGKRGQEAMDVLEMSAKAAATGLGETKDVARAVTAIMTAYASSGMTAQQATDQLLVTVRAGSLEASELAPALGRVLAIASELNVPFHELGASIATFTKMGVSSSEAVTAIRGVLNSLIKPTKQGKEALESVGTSFAELRQEIAEKGLAPAMVALVKKFGDNKEALARVIPSVEALTTVLSTAGSQAEEYMQIADQIANSNGALDKAFKIASQGAGFMFKQVLTQLKNMALRIGLIILPTFTKILGGVRTVMSWISKLPNSVLVAAVGFGALLAAIGPIALALSAMITFAGPAFAFISGAAATAGAAIAAISAPVVLIAVAIGSLVALFVNYMGGVEAMMKTIVDKVVGIFNWIKPLAIQFGMLMGTIFVGIWRIAVKIFNAIAETVRFVFNKIMEYVQPVLTFFRDTLIEAMIVAEFGLKNIGEIGKVAFLNMLLGVIRFAENIKYYFTVYIPETFKWFAENFFNILTDMFNYAGTVFTNMGKNITAIFQNITAIIKGEMSADDLWTPLTKGFVSAIKDLPNIPPREIGAFESSLELQTTVATKSLKKKFTDFRNERLQMLFPNRNIAKEAEKLGDKTRRGFNKGVGGGDDKKKKKEKDVSEVDAVGVRSAEAFARVMEFRSNKPRAITPQNQVPIVVEQTDEEKMQSAIKDGVMKTTEILGEMLGLQKQKPKGANFFSTVNANLGGNP